MGVACSGRDRQRGDHGPAVADGDGDGEQTGAGIRPLEGASGGERFPSGVMEHRMRCADCHKGSQLPL